MVHTKVPKVTHAYCGARLPLPSHVKHRLLPSSFSSPRRIFSCFALTAAELDIVDGGDVCVWLACAAARTNRPDAISSTKNENKKREERKKIRAKRRKSSPINGVR